MTLGTHHWMNLKTSGCDHMSCAWESFEQVMVMVMIDRKLKESAGDITG